MRFDHGAKEEHEKLIMEFDAHNRNEENIQVQPQVTLNQEQHSDLCQSNIRYLQTHDILTGTHNRISFERELERIQQEKTTGLSLVMVDINGLRLVNDAFGHNVGDQLLSEVAAVLRDVAGEHIIARVGNDEFAILLQDTTRQEADNLCTLISDTCAQIRHYLLPVTVACGAAFRDTSDLHVKDLYRLAENRMLSSKMLVSGSLHSQVISSLREAMSARNLETSEHMDHMEFMVTRLGHRLGLPNSELNRLQQLASMHDIGKVAIPDHIIAKPGPLTREEWAIMRTHSEIGSRIARASLELSDIAEEIRAHHERWDGDGYPDGKAGEAIPLLARVICVVDAYNVMTSRRVYKEPVDHAAALEELRRCAGTQFDPGIVALFDDIFGSMSGTEIERMAGQFSYGQDDSASASPGNSAGQ